MKNEECFSFEYKKRRAEGKRYALQRAKVRNKRFIKGVSALAVCSVMIGGVVKFIPSMFKTSYAINDEKTISYETDNNIKKEYQKVDKKIIKETETSLSDDSKDSDKIEDTVALAEEDETAYPVFVVGGNGSDIVDEFINSDIGYYLFEYSADYGVDPYVMASICMQETSLEHDRCCPGGDRYSGYGVGYMQLESPSGQEVVAYNYSTGEEDVEYITMENACDPIMNIKLGCMIMQNSINHYKGNQLLAIQSHNYGEGMLDSILYSNYDDVDSLEQNYSDTSWSEYVVDAYYNPLNYISDWDEGTYGDKDYVSHVLSHCPVATASYRYNGSNITVDLASGQVLGVMEVDSKTR